MTDLQDAQTRFVELMTELIQLNEAQALDVGIYRVIRHRNRAVRRFIGEIESVGSKKKLAGGGADRSLQATQAAHRRR